MVSFPFFSSLTLGTSFVLFIEGAADSAAFVDAKATGAVLGAEGDADRAPVVGVILPAGAVWGFEGTSVLSNPPIRRVTRAAFARLVVRFRAFSDDLARRRRFSALLAVDDRGIEEWNRKIPTESRQRITTYPNKKKYPRPNRVTSDVGRIDSTVSLSRRRIDITFSLSLVSSHCIRASHDSSGFATPKPKNASNCASSRESCRASWEAPAFSTPVDHHGKNTHRE